MTPSEWLSFKTAASTAILYITECFYVRIVHSIRSGVKSATNLIASLTLSSSIFPSNIPLFDAVKEAYPLLFIFLISLLQKSIELSVLFSSSLRTRTDCILSRSQECNYLVLFCALHCVAYRICEAIFPK